MKKKERAVVLSQECIATDIYSMWIETPDIAAEAIPGQFITLYTKDADKLLPRPISLCEIDKKNGRLRIVYRIAGAGTKEFSAYKAGDAVEIMGPLGNGFSETGKKPMVIGGGIGIPPMLGLAKSLKESGSDVTAVLGYRSELFLQDEFASSSNVYNATEDGNSGTKGTVIDAIKENNLDADIIFACGPKPMLHKKRFHVIFLLRSVWHVESELVLHVYVRQKMWMVIQMCITPESARTVLYLKQRR